MTEVIVYSIASCPYCDRAKMLLQQKNVEFTEIRADLDPSKLTEMLAKSDGRRTFPQIFINGKGIGGFSDLWDLEQRDQLNKLLNEEN